MRVRSLLRLPERPHGRPGLLLRSAFTAGLLALLAASPSRAAIDAELNTSNFVPGQVSEISIDGIVTPGGPSSGITACGVVLRYDTAQVTVSGLRAGSGWSLEASNQTTTDGGWVKAVLTNMSGNGAGQTVTGPILYFTVTPANGGVDPALCGTLRFAGVESDLADQAFEEVYPSDPCAGRMAPMGRDASSIGDSSTTPSLDLSDGEGERATAPECTPDVVLARQLLMVAGGLRVPTANDTVWDSDSDGRISVVDVTAVIKAPCGAPGVIWHKDFETANCSTMPAVADIDKDVYGRLDAVFSTDIINPQVYDPDPTRDGNPQQVYVLTDTSGAGDIDEMWPEPFPMRDAPMGLALANIAGTEALEILATNYQDNYSLGGPSNIYSHLYAWNYNGAGVNIGGGDYEFAFHLDPDNPNGIGVGHIQRAPVVMNLSGQNPPEVFVAYQGQWDVAHSRFVGGGMTVIDSTVPRPANNAIIRTQSVTPPPGQGSQWYTFPYDNSLFDSGPTFPRTTAGARHIVLASETGLVYRWDTFGNTVSGWYPAADGLTGTDQYVGSGGVAHYASLVNPLVTANLDGSSGDEILGVSGLVYNYWASAYSPNPILDGAVYCWRPNGTLYWRYPALQAADPQDFGPTITSGLAVGRLKGGSNLCVVFGDADGTVTALSSSGSLLWTFSTRPPHHVAYRPMWAQPLIADLTGDGKQDVIVGNANGYVYAIDGDTGVELWHTVTAPDLDTDYLGVVESHYKEVRGLAVAPLNASDTTKAVILVTSGPPALTNPPPVGGYAAALEGPEGSYSSQAADWPQYQGNEMRTGTYPRP